MKTITLTPDKVPFLLKGHPWIFPKAILKDNSEKKAGTLVQLLHPKGERLAVGMYNPHSLYRVRVLATELDPLDELLSIEAIVSYRLKQAIALRQRLNLPNSATTAFRLFNSEAEGLSGLTIDQFNEICVISSSAYWVEAHRQLILECLRTCLPHQKLLWMQQRKPLTQDGWTDFSEEILFEQTIIQEAGIQFKIDLSSAQKTGLFLDQRENHERIAQFSKGRRVLDLYTYSGGFALHAAKAGATQVLAVDSSAQAIARAQENAVLNQVDQIEWSKGDARDYLSQAAHFDVVILDPPKLIPSIRNQEQAKNYYRFLHREVFKAMRPNTLFMTCNCSSALNSQSFVELIYRQALVVGKNARILGVYGPSVCHPTLPSFPEGQYLTAVLGMVC